MDTAHVKITILGGAGMIVKGIIRDLLSDRAIIKIEERRVSDSSAQRLTAFPAMLP
jgi:hypothetical protein